MSKIVAKIGKVTNDKENEMVYYRIEFPDGFEGRKIKSFDYLTTHTEIQANKEVGILMTTIVATTIVLSVQDQYSLKCDGVLWDE